MRSLRLGTALVAIVLLSALSIGCVVPRSGLDATDTEELPERLQPATGDEVPTTNPTAPWIAELFWVREDTLVPAAVTLGGPVSPDPLLEALADGPTGADAQASLRTAFQDPSLVLSTALSRGTVVVDLDERFATTMGADQVRALGQIVFSLTSIPGIERVRFTVEGEDASVPTPDGTVVERPVTRSDYLGLIDLTSLLNPS